MPYGDLPHPGITPGRRKEWAQRRRESVEVRLDIYAAYARKGSYPAAHLVGLAKAQGQAGFRGEPIAETKIAHLAAAPAAVFFDPAGPLRA